MSLIVQAMEHVASGRHLRVQRIIVGLSAADIARAMAVSPTRIRQLEDAARVTERAAARYLEALRSAWLEREQRAVAAATASSPDEVDPRAVVRELVGAGA